MQKNKKNVLLGSLKVMCAVALLATISIICGKFLSFPQEGTFRFSVENLPILLAGVVFGPVAGAITGLLADLLGCFLRGWAPLPLVTAGAVAIGLTSGLLYRFIAPKSLALRTGIAVFGAHALGSVLIKTLGLAHAYGSPFLPTLGWRGLNYLVIGALEFLLLYLLLRNKAVSGQLNRFR